MEFESAARGEPPCVAGAAAARRGDELSPPRLVMRELPLRGEAEAEPEADSEGTGEAESEGSVSLGRGGSAADAATGEATTGSDVECTGCGVVVGATAGVGEGD